MAEAAVRVRGVGRRFGSGPTELRALSGVSFDVGSGEVVALLGANGAGKTTLTKILSTLLLPTSGSAWVLGRSVTDDVKSVRRDVSVVFGGDRGLYPRLSGLDNLHYFGMLEGVGRSELRGRAPAMLEQVGLADAAGQRVETYSKGMRQRLHIAAGLISRPRVLLLDEPTVGLDPMEADRLRRSVAALRADGVSVLLTSHYLLDVERLADRVVMLQSGRVTADLPLAEFAARAGHVAVVVLRVRGAVPDVSGLLPPDASVDSYEATAGGAELRLRLRTWGGSVFTALGALLDGCDVEDVQVRPASLEEAFASVAAPTPPEPRR